MKTILEINGSNYGSTGNIALNVASKARENNFNAYTFVLKSKESLKHKNSNQIFYGIWIERIISERLSLLTGLRDTFNVFGTLDLIYKIKKYKPDLIHLHVIHDDFINISILFNYIKKLNIPIIWTFHDCWSLTGHCPYFDIVDCQKWKTECHDCPQWSEGPKSLFFDTSKSMFKRKAKCFSNVKNLTIVTPSKWLESITRESMFKEYEIRTIYNGIDLSRFKYINDDYKDKLNIKDKYLILGVANYWIYRKGIDVMIKLSEILPSNYQIVLVGTNNEIDKILPDKIISIHRTYNQDELVKIYSSADVFANPTREEVFGLVNVEALACGTPVVVFNTGGCPEIIDETCGKVIEKNDVEKMKNAIINICENKTIAKENCFAKAKQFDKETSFEQYIKLYKEKLNVK